MQKNAAQGVKIVDAFCLHLFSRVCGRHKPEYLNWSTMSDDAIIQGGIGDLRSQV